MCAQAFEADQVGKRQAIADMIANIEAEACPYTSMVKKISKPNQKIYDHQAEIYPRRGHRGVLDGKDVPEHTHQPRHALKSIAQKAWDNPAVSDFAEETVVAGIPGRGEMSRQKAISLVVVKRIIESRALSDSDCLEDNGTSEANETRGQAAWISNSAQTTYPVPEAVRTPADSIYTSTVALFTEEEMVDITNSIYKQRREKSDLDMFIGVTLKTHITKYSVYVPDVASNSVVRQFNQSAEAKALYRCIDTLNLDTARVNLHLSTFLYTDPDTGEDTAKTHRSGLIFDMNKVFMAYTRLPRIRNFEDRGGGPRASVDTIFLHGNANPLGHGKAEISS